jgi:hypothetical protein
LEIGLLLELLDGMKYPHTSSPPLLLAWYVVVASFYLVLSAWYVVVASFYLVLSASILASCTSRTSSLVRPRWGPRREVLCTSGCLRWTSLCTLGARHCAPQRSQLAYGTHQRSRPFANGKNRGVFSLGLKPFVNGSCTQTGGNIVMFQCCVYDFMSNIQDVPS